MCFCAMIAADLIIHHSSSTAFSSIFPHIANGVIIPSGGVHLWKECYEQCWAMCQGLTSLYAAQLWIFHGSNTFSSVSFVVVLASNGTLLKLHCSPCSLDAAGVWQHFDLKQPQAKLWLKMQQMTIRNPHSCRYCIYSPNLGRREWHCIVSADKTLKSISFSFVGK